MKTGGLSIIQKKRQNEHVFTKKCLKLKQNILKINANI